MRTSLKKILAAVTVMIMCMGLISCGSESKPEDKSSSEPEPVQMKQFVTKDNTYKITAGEEWTECDPYQNSESSLEIEIGGGITLLQIVKQTKSGLGYDLNGFSKEVVGYFTGNSALGKSTIESTENITCGDYKAIRNIIITDESSSGIKMLSCHISIETEKDYMQFIIISTESNRDKILKYADEISNTITPL